eukprot:6215160-Prymnesium_polylepis.1
MIQGYIGTTPRDRRDTMAQMAAKSTPEGETGLTTLGRPDLRGCALLDSWQFWCPRGLTGSPRVPDTYAFRTAVRRVTTDVVTRHVCA